MHSTQDRQQYSVVPTPDINKGWHTFTRSWTKTRLTRWYDGKQVLTTTIGVPQQPMYLILNLAIDDASPGGCNGALNIKSVKIWVPRETS